MLKSKLLSASITDTDVLTFISNASITNSTQKKAVNFLVTNLKSNGLWSTLLAIYPFVGGTANAHKYNLKSASTYTLTFNGGWSHASTGATPNGSTGYANTGLVPSTACSDGVSLSCYCGTNPASNTVQPQAMGGGGGGSQLSFAITAWDGSVNTMDIEWVYGSGNTPVFVKNGSAKGFYTATKRNSDGYGAAYQNGVLRGSSNNTTALTTWAMFIGAQNAGGTMVQPCNYEFRFASIGNNLTQAQVTLLENIINAYQTILGRQCNTNNYFYGDSFTAGNFGTQTQANTWPTLLDALNHQTNFNRGTNGMSITQNRVVGNCFDMTTIPQKGIRDNKLCFTFSCQNDYQAALTVSPFTNTIANMQNDLTTIINYAVSNRGWSYADIVLIGGYYIATGDPNRNNYYAWMDGFNAVGTNLGIKTIDNRAYETANGGDSLVVHPSSSFDNHPNLAAQAVIAQNIANNWN